MYRICTCMLQHALYYPLQADIGQHKCNGHHSMPGNPLLWATAVLHLLLKTTSLSCPLPTEVVVDLLLHPPPPFLQYIASPSITAGKTEWPWLFFYTSL